MKKKQQKPRRTLFAGELMTCIVCGAQEHHDPAVSSQWRAIEVDDGIYYACPNEFPPDPGTREDFATAYQLILSKIILEQAKASGGEVKKLEREFEGIYERWKIRLIQLRRRYD